LTEILDLDAEKIPLGKLSFFREQLKHQLHEVVLRKFHSIRDGKKPDFTKRDLARRIGRKPEQVTRWLGAPGNLTIDTMSDLLIGMGAILDPVSVDVDSLVVRSGQEPPMLLQSEGQPKASIPPPSPNLKDKKERKGLFQ
jgi:hypothetical protein